MWYESRVLAGASYGEWAFVALLVVLVLLAPVAPRLGEAVGAWFEKPRPGGDGPPAA